MFPRWLSVAFFLMVMYIAYSASQTGAPVPVQKIVAPVISAQEYPALVEITDVEGWKRKLNPDYASVMNCTLGKPTAKDGLIFSAAEHEAGEGVAAVCGDEVTVKMTVWNASGAQTFEGEMVLALGSRQVAAGFDFGLLSMKVGGERLLILPPYALARGTAGAGHEAVRKVLPLDTLSVVKVRRLK